jgi:hypothetical protein
MRDAILEQGWHKVDDWLFVILRFAITRAQADRAAIAAMAADLDRLGTGAARSEFAFFARTSAEICDLIVDDHRPERVAALGRYIGMIDNDRLRRALEAVLDFDRRATSGVRMRMTRKEALWYGLPIRH